MRQSALVLASMAAFALFAGYRLTAPWQPAGNGDEAYAGTQYQAICHHLLTHGLWRARCAQFRIFHALALEEITDAAGEFRGRALRQTHGDLFWVSRLPFGALLHTAALRLFGKDGSPQSSSEWVLRLVPLSAGLLLIAVLWLLLRPALGNGMAAFCAAICGLMPGMVIWARMPGYEMPCLFLSSLALIFYAAQRQGWPVLAPGRCFVAAWLCALLASIIGWFGLLAVAIMLFDAFLRPPVFGSRRKCLAFVAIPALVIGVYVFYLHILAQPLAERLGYFWHERSLGSAFSAEGGRHVGMLPYFQRISAYFVNHLTPLPLVLSLGWLLVYLRKRRQGERMVEAWLVFAFATFGGLIYIAALRSSFEHRCYTLWWLPFLAVSSGCCLHRACAVLRQPAKAIVPLALFAALAATSGYKVWRQKQKCERSAERMAFFLKCGDVLPPDAQVAIGGIGAFSAIDIVPGHPSCCFQTVVKDAKHPALFYLWRRTADLLYCCCDLQQTQGPSYIILPLRLVDKMPKARLLLQDKDAALLYLPAAH